MKLKETTHKERFCGEEIEEKFNIHSNRFYLFDRKGRRLNKWSVAKLPNYLELEVLEVTKSGFNSSVYFVGFPVTHIKLNVLDNNLLDYSKLTFGEEDNE